MTAANVGHAWVLERLPAHAAGLLDERDESLLMEHLAACEACRSEAAQNQPLTAEDLEDARHLPPSLIARWESTTLEGLEREMVGAHLARCAACRRDLALLGHAPELPVAAAGIGGNGTARAVDLARTAGMAGAAGMVGAAGAARERSQPAHRIATPGSNRRRSWIPWAVGSAVAASLIAVTLSLRSPGPDAPGSMSPLANGPAPSDPVDPIAPHTTPTISRRMVLLESPERGVGTDEVQTIDLGADEHSVRLVIEPLVDVPLDAPVVIQLLAADGTQHAESRLTHREAVHPERGVLFRLDLQPLEEGGPLTLRASTVPAAGSTAPAETASYRIRFRRER